MLNWTGHPLVDVGIAVILSFVDKEDPQTVTENDLTVVADFIEREYVRQPLTSYLNVALPNSGFTQPAFSKTPERRFEYAVLVSRYFGGNVETTDEKCVFTGLPTPAIIYNGPSNADFQLGRAYRQHVPMTLGVGNVNFYPNGDSGLPVSAAIMLAFQAFPLGCAKVSGRLLAVHSNDPALTLFFANQFWEGNRSAISMAHAQDSTKLAGRVESMRTLLVQELANAYHHQIERRNAFDDQYISLTAYYLTNMGANPEIAIFSLPSSTIRFLSQAQSADYAPIWNRIVSVAWEQEPTKDKKKRKEGDEPYQPRRNWLYEDIWTLPQNAKRFLKTYFLRRAWKYASLDKGDPRASYSLMREVDLVSWRLTSLFMERIMNMNKEQVEQVRTLADALANYIATENDKSFFRRFATVSKYYQLRLLLIKANTEYARLGNAPFLTLDNFLGVFEEGEEIAYSNWDLSRDLVLIRLVEQLHASGWLSHHQDELDAIADQHDAVLEKEIEEREGTIGE